MALFIFLLILINKFTLLFGFNYPDNVKVMITPSLGAHNHALFRIDETLNLTCSITSELPDVLLEWILPGKITNSQNKVDFINGKNWRNMVIKNLQENDSGEYKCTASSNSNPDLMLEKVIRINVKPRKPKCGEMLFQCRNGGCIPKRFTCDGRIDCKGGEDEADDHCGPEPCKDKPICSDGRCIPQSWCCDPAQLNCTLRSLKLCCTHPLRDTLDDGSYTQEKHRYNDVTLFQTTVYTVIGCAMAFMFIVTIFIVVVCRVHMRRTLMPPIGTPYVSQSPCRATDRFNALPFYDFDVLLNRSNDGMSVNPLLVTYNINNGVQFVGRPVDPPPYCEVVATPPREGPPPPYMSRENLADNANEEAQESDALLTPNISVISSCEIDETTIPVPDNSNTNVEPIAENGAVAAPS